MDKDELVPWYLTELRNLREKLRNELRSTEHAALSVAIDALAAPAAQPEHYCAGMAEYQDKPAAQADSGSRFGRDADWVLAMAEALGTNSGYQVPCVPEVEPFRQLFADIRAAQADAEPVAHQHKWSRDGERCEKCGDKDWMGGPCSVPDTAPPSGVLEGMLRAERDVAFSALMAAESWIDKALPALIELVRQIDEFVEENGEASFFTGDALLVIESAKALRAEAEKLPQSHEWTLIAPDGRSWRGSSPLNVASKELNERRTPTEQLENLKRAMAYEQSHVMVPVERSYGMRSKAMIAFNQASGDLDDKLEAAHQAMLRAAQEGKS